MSEFVWIPTRAGRRENAAASGAALVVAVGTAAVTFWLVRTLLSREALEVRPPRMIPDGEGPGRLP